MTTELLDPQVSLTGEAYQVRTIEEMGALIGVPIKEKPLWGSRRERGRAVCPIPEYCPMEPELTQSRATIIVYSGNCEAPWGETGTHRHFQYFQVVAVGPRAMLIDVTASSRKKHKRSQRWLLGVDERLPFIEQMSCRVPSVHAAYNALKPEEVFRAEAKGLCVKRQGDWFFIPGMPTIHVPAAKKNKKWDRIPLDQFYRRPQTYRPRLNPYIDRELKLMLSSRAGTSGPLYTNPCPIQPTRHIAEEILPGYICRHAVRGRITAPDHADLVLDDWHTAIRNTAGQD